MAITYHSNQRGVPGSLVYLAGPGGGTVSGTVIPAMTIVDQTGAAVGGGTSTSPTVTQNQGSGSIATSQASAPTGTSAQIVAARAGRNAVTITNVTGAQQVYVGATGVTAATGQLIPATVGASLTIPTQAAIFAISLTAAQTVSILETF
jgi:hypothetical protein